MSESALFKVLRSGRYLPADINITSDIVIGTLLEVSSNLTEDRRHRLYRFFTGNKWNLIKEILDSEMYKDTTRAREYVERKFQEAATLK